MKMLKLAGLVFPALLAANAGAAVVARMNPIPTRINPLAGLPTNLPNPVIGPLAGRGVTLPAPLMLPTPMLLAPALAAPSALPTAFSPAAVAAPVAPMAVAADRALSVLPASFLPAAADGKKAAQLAPAPAAPARAAGDDMRNLFDGSRNASGMEWQPILPRDRRPAPTRRHSLPEDDLERELGMNL